MGDKTVLTHHVAVAAYIFDREKLLLLRRSNPPYTFAPPGGSLDAGEDPLCGIMREVYEETKLRIEISGVAHTWFGKISDNYPPLLCINYLAQSVSKEVILSSEHTEYVWVTRGDIVERKITTVNENGKGYQPKDILDAFDKYAKLIEIK